MVKKSSKRKSAQEMSQAEYAKHRGVSRVTVTKWKKKGILVFAGSGKIDVTQTDAILDEGNKSAPDLGNRVTDPPGNRVTNPPVNKSSSSKTKKKSKPTVVDEEAMPEILDGLQALLDRVDSVSEYKAKEIKENYLALLRKLEFELKAEKVVEMEPVRKLLFELWRQERDALLNLPSRICAEMAAELGVDQNRLTILLERHINEFLNQRADQPMLRLG